VCSSKFGNQENPFHNGNRSRQNPRLQRIFLFALNAGVATLRNGETFTKAVVPIALTFVAIFHNLANAA